MEFDKSPDIEKILLDDSRNFTSEEEEEEDKSVSKPKDYLIYLNLFFACNFYFIIFV